MIESHFLSNFAQNLSIKYCLFNIAFWGLLFFNLFEAAANSNIYTISGRVTEAKTNSPLPGASILIKGTYLWAVSNQKGEFTIQGVQEGKYNLEVSFLGYVPATIPVNVRSNINNLPIILKENTLALDDVVVTAQAPKNELNTTLTIGNHALEHLQVSNVSDISALLPGGKTKVPDLTTNNIFSLRDGGSTAGNAAFGTAVEVDGVRIGNNGSFGNMSGVDTRNITVADIESVEVITGVPSAEYGDLNSGMVKIHTRKGKTPWNILLSINPRTEQVSFAKGLDLGNDKGVININGEWTKATQKLVSPYSSYTRRGFSAGYSNTFRNVLRFDIGVTGNIGGMNTKDENELWNIRQNAGMVFQNPDNQIIGTIVEEDVGFGPENLGVPTDEIWQRVEESLKAVGMYKYRKHSPNKLSGGQKQRVAIAGVMAMHPRCIVLDEPTAMLDPHGRKSVIETVRKLNKEEGITVILITHYMEEVIEADHVFVMDDGNLVMDGTPREVFSQVEKLKELRLDVPQATLLAYELQKKGFPLRDGILSNEELVEELCQLKSKM